MYLSKNSKINNLVKELLLNGWSIVRKKRHTIIMNPSGQKIPVPCTPSDRRAFYNFRSNVRKMVG